MEKARRIHPKNLESHRLVNISPNNRLKKKEVLCLKSYGWIHPDFAILNKRLRKEIYWEHLGKMDDVGYVDDNIRRILMYEKNGYYLGDKLILTFETQKIPLNSLEIDRMIQKYLL